MENNFGLRIKKAWNAFMNRGNTVNEYSYGSYYRPDRIRLLEVMNDLLSQLLLIK